MGFAVEIANRQKHEEPFQHKAQQIRASFSQQQDSISNDGSITGGMQHSSLTFLLLKVERRKSMERGRELI
jgi:hypothetical protein